MTSLDHGSPPARLLVAIPVYGHHQYTEAVLDDLSTQTGADFEILVVDNKGDYRPSHSEHVVRPGDNVGWAGGSNRGFREGFTSGFSHVMTLNNDVRLSPGFLAGIMDHRLPSDAGIIAPLYDDKAPSQRCDHRGAAEEFTPRERYRRVAAVDGTSLTLTRDAWTAVGGLSEDAFGRYAWGADIHLSMRVRAAGFSTVVTERSYLSHLGRKTADAIAGRSYAAHASIRFLVGIWTTTGQRKWSAMLRAQPMEFYGLSDHELLEDPAAGRRQA